MRGGILSLAIANTLALGAYGAPGYADPAPPHHVYEPKPTPRGGDTHPWVVAGSSSAIIAQTVAVIGDSVARDYAYYIARQLGPHGVRVVDGALSGCAVGTLPFVSAIHGVRKQLRDGRCPGLVVDKQRAVIRDYAPKLVLWHSITEMWDIGVPGTTTTAAPSGSEEWGRRLMRQWDDTLHRVTAGGAQVVVILPLWYERTPPVKPGTPGPSVDKLRDIYLRWAARNKVTVVDVAPVACPTGPPCGPVRGIDFRPDTTHFDDPGGAQIATYLTTHVPALARLASG